VTATTDQVTAEPTQHRPTRPATPVWVRWLPLAATVTYVAAVLLAADTAPLDLVRYAGYVVLALMLPGTLVYRLLRRTPHTLVEDLVMGIAVGLVLELPAWVLASVLDLRGLLWAWPLLVVGPFALVPRLRRHWRVRGYTPAPLGWSWTVGGAVAFFTTYLSSVFLQRNQILPTSDRTLQYLDLAYQLSLAGEAKHQFPMHVPQVADEPLLYHWFGYAHMAATSMVGGIDLPVVALRLTIPGLCALAVLLTAVVGWRVSGKPYAGAVAAVLFFVVGETSFTDPVGFPFGTQATFVVWHGMSMIYSWVLLIAAIAAVADVIDRRRDPERPVPALGRRAFVLVALFALASSGAKASSLPVLGLALLVTAVAMLFVERRIPWAIIAAGLLTAGAQLFATAVLYRFQAYGVAFDPWLSFEVYTRVPPEGWTQTTAMAGVVVAFLVNMQLRATGILSLIWIRRGRLDAAQWLLLSGALAGTFIFLMVRQAGWANQYFERAGFAFAVLLSGWGFVLVWERARMTRASTAALGVFAVLLAVALVVIQFRYAGELTDEGSMSQVLPILRWAAILGLVAVGAAVVWAVAGFAVRPLRGRGGIFLLTAILLAGTPGLIMDMRKSERYPNGGAYAVTALPRSRVEAARWVRDNSSPDQVLATNAHCRAVGGDGVCDARSFWLSAYSERRVLVEGWLFAPRVSETGERAFWDPALLALNDEAFTAPTPSVLDALRARGVRWLVADRTGDRESPALPELARLRYDNGRDAVYELT
jgi:hypothetical protein